MTWAPRPRCAAWTTLHQYAALPFLRGLFSERVLGAIALHVDAKRCLCADAMRATRPQAVRQIQSAAWCCRVASSRAEQAAAFIGQAGARATRCMLRQWDDLAKVEGWPSRRRLSHFLVRAMRCALG